MNINVILLAKLKNSCITDYMEVYNKRFPKTWNVNYMERKTILSKVKKDNSFYVLLDEKGEKVSSQQFAGYLTKWNNFSLINFYIGGSYGFSKEDYSISDKMIALSDLTFPHSFVPLILMEQIYRAYTIINNHPYHH